MKPDDFESQLRRQPRRPVPAEWRAEILEAAQAANARLSALDSRPSPAPWWREWLWPCPQAWAGLAALWIVIIGLNAEPPATSAAAASPSATPTPEMKTALAAQRRELARLLDLPIQPASPAAIPGPRSDHSSPSTV